MLSHVEIGFDPNHANIPSKWSFLSERRRHSGCAITSRASIIPRTVRVCEQRDLIQDTKRVFIVSRADIHAMNVPGSPYRLLDGHPPEMLHEYLTSGR